MHPNNELKHYTELKKKDAAKLGFKLTSHGEQWDHYTYKGKKLVRSSCGDDYGFYCDGEYVGETYGEVIDHFKGSR